MKRKIGRGIVFYALILIISISIFSTVGFSIWWDGDWPYKQSINLSTNSGNTPVNASYPITLNSSNVGTGFDWNNECSSNSTRIRFLNQSETGVLDHWVEQCSSSNKSMKVWVEIDQNITTTPTQIQMYYQNPSATLTSNASAVFDYYFNFSKLNIQPEGSGSSQDNSGNGIILDNGRTFNTWGNSWKVFDGFGTIPLAPDGTQLLELMVKSPDCGEITATKFDTDTVQEENGGYQWCGSQTNWAPFGDDTYSESGKWERVGSLLDDYTIDATHLHLPIDDDGDASGNASYKDIRIRKYYSSTISYNFGLGEAVGTRVVDLSPESGFITGNTIIDFTCQGVTNNGSELSTMSLYGNWTGTWALNETKSISGNLNSTTFSKTFPDTSSSYKWNCRVKDNSSNTDFNNFNYTFEIDKTPPKITISNPPATTIQDVTPFITTNFSETLSKAQYSIDNSLNKTLCTNCSSINSTYLILPEGVHNLTITATDLQGNSKSKTRSFSVDMNEKFTEEFLDNSSIATFNETTHNKNNISFTGTSIEKYNGIEKGYDSTNMVFTQNQWGGNSNAGEVDITCPGGDSACWFTTQNGTNISGLDISNGVTTEDSDSSTVGFIMYSQTDVHSRFSSPTPHPENSNNFIAVCYNSGQWFYDDNNGCTNAFTPVASDLLIANMTWGITSVTPLENMSLEGNTTLLSNPIETTNNITSITNVSWIEKNTNINNSIDIDISVDNGTTWYNTTNTKGITNITKGNILKFKVFFTSDGESATALNSLNISWIHSNAPEIILLNPTNNSKIISNGTQELKWFIEDEDENISTKLYINNSLNKTLICSTATNCSTNISVSRGIYNWSISAEDTLNATTNSSTKEFRIIENQWKTISKSIRYNNASIYSNTITLKNKVPNYSRSFKVFDFVPKEFTAGSFNPIFDFNKIFSSGTLYTWNFTFSPLSSLNINYTITNSEDEYLVKNNFIVGLD